MVINSLVFMAECAESYRPAYYDEFMGLCLLYGRSGKFSLHVNKTSYFYFRRKFDSWCPPRQVIKIISLVPQKLDMFQMWETTIMGRGVVGYDKNGTAGFAEIFFFLPKPTLIFCLDNFNLCFCVLWLTKEVKR